jgi:hypothetical protein
MDWRGVEGSDSRVRIRQTNHRFDPRRSASIRVKVSSGDCALLAALRVDDWLDYDYDYEHDYEDEHEQEQERRLSIFE